MSTHTPPGRGNSPTRALGGRPRELRIKRFSLSVIGGPDQGLEKISDAAEFSIGTEAGNDLVLTDSAVSRHHCVIASTDAGYRVRDLGSTNGTFIGGLRVDSAYPDPGATIRVGETTLRFDGLDEELTELLSDDERFGRALGTSPAMRRIFALLPRIAASDSTVLLEGETGTGKSLLADAIHRDSSRKDGPFIVLDCSAIPPTLIESELFGHEKGAFTGAIAARPGVFVAARGGTLFLDEIGELPLDMQPKLLRALEDRVVRPVGGVRQVDLDVRVIAATNRDLRAEVNKGQFRADLYYRLNIVRLRIPPLRERREDIPLLMSHFYAQYAGDGDDHPPAELLAHLMRQSWPGNVRELRSAVERAVLMDDPVLWRELTDPEPEQPGHAAVGESVFDPSLSFRAAKQRAVSQWERWFVTELCGRHDGNLSQAARAARMDRNHLRELLKKHHVSTADD